MIDKKRFEVALNRNEFNNASEKYVYIPLGGFFTRILLHTRITPNQLTVFWGVLMFVSAFGFMFGDHWLNVLCGVCWVIAYALDSADGPLARYTNLKSGRGDYIDGINHRLTFPLLMFCIGYYAYMHGRTEVFGFSFDPVYYLIAGVLAGTCMVLIIDCGNIYNRIMPEEAMATNDGTVGLEGEYVKHKSLFKKVIPYSPLPFTNMLLLIPFFALFGFLDVFIVFYGIIYFAGALFRASILCKKIPGPDMSKRFR